MNRPRFTYATVVAALALFLALGGASYAAVKIKSGQVKTKDLNSVVTEGPRGPVIGAVAAASGAVQFQRQASAARHFLPDRGRWSGEYTDETGAINFNVDRTKKYRRAHVRAQVRGYASCNGRPVSYNFEGYSKSGWKIGTLPGEKHPVGGFGFGGPLDGGGRLSVYMFATYMSHIRARGYVRVVLSDDPDFGDCDLYHEWYAKKKHD